MTTTTNPQIIDFRVRPPMRDDASSPSVGLPDFMGRYIDVYRLDEKVQATFEDLDSKSQRDGVDLCVIQAEMEVQPAAPLNKRTHDLVSRSPKRYVGFAAVDPVEPGAQETTTRALDELELRGVNVQPWANGVLPNDALYDWVWRLCAEREIPVTVHTGMNFHLSHSMMLGHPLAIDDVAGRFPGLKIVMNHGAWPWLDEALAILWRQPHVFVEFGAIAPRQLGDPHGLWGKVAPLLDDWLGTKVLLATDWPLVSFRRALEEFRNLDLRADVLSAVLGGNARRVLGL